MRGGRVDQDRVAATAPMLQTTSLFLPILASIDASRRQMALHGGRLLGRTIALAQDARFRLDALPGIEVLDGHRAGIEHIDPTRFAIDVHGLLTRYAVERIRPSDSTSCPR